MPPALTVEIVDASMEMDTAHNLHYFRHPAIGNVLNLYRLSVPRGFTSQGFRLA